ncbi:DUF2378 family protein [Archangium violaceum]|uniref:TIGR02265 family protein n=1 Tax=Archangium violaceum TaxID=83451 RepID=UPI00194EC6E1|nr:TIGR02265 family protein [Archangium violaceum]QRN97953.1 DUF2378 family protein [Archangium violaceum]
MSRAAPEDTVRGLFFNSVLTAVRKLGCEAAVRSCHEAGGEGRFLDFYSYPLRTFLRLLGCAARELGARMGGGEAVLRELGRHANAGFLASPVGRMAVLMSYGSPRRMMESMPDMYRHSLSFGEQWVVWTGQSRGRFVLRGDFLPSACHEGVLEAMLESSGGRRVRVSREWTHELDGEYAFSWG